MKFNSLQRKLLTFGFRLLLMGRKIQWSNKKR